MSQKIKTNKYVNPKCFWYQYLESLKNFTTGHKLQVVMKIKDLIRNIPNWKQIRREEQKVNHVNKTIKKSSNLGEAACNLVRHWLWEWLQISNRKYPFQNMFKRKLQAVYFHRYIKSSLLHNFGNILLKSKWVFPINEFCKYHRILWEFCN